MKRGIHPVPDGRRARPREVKPNAPGPSPQGVARTERSTTGWPSTAPASWPTRGYFLFGLIGIALFVETIQATVDQRGADPIAAGIMTVVFFVMTHLFATTRIKD